MSDEISDEKVDITLIKKALNGNTSAFEQLVCKYERQVYSLAFFYLKNKEDAEDAAQEVFLKFWKNLSSYKGEASVCTYILKITKNTCIDMLRRGGTEVVSADEEDENGKTLLEDIRDEDSDSSPPDAYNEKERASEIREAIMSLPGKYREVLILKDMQERSYTEICEILSINMGTLKSRLSRARLSLKIILTKRNIFPE